MYMNAAINLLKTMTEKFVDWNPENDQMLGYGSVRYPIPGQFNEQTAGVHVSIIYAEYFYTEAILKLIGAEFFPW